MALPLPRNPLNDPWVLIYSILVFMTIIAVAFSEAGELDEDLTKVYVIKTWAFCFN
jgi:hypothetical protein